MTRVDRPGEIAARRVRALGAAGLAARAAAVMATVMATGPAIAAEQMLPVPVATIYAGDVIKPTMLREQAFPEGYRPRLPVADTAARAVGRIARRTLLPGETIPSIALEEAKLVTRGAPAVIVFEEHGVTISTVGTALANAAVNEAVNVRNAATGRVVQGIVQPDGRVRTGQP
ncbi:flagellar basal body P-ring formation chaperone FlgA [Methylobacterium radiotolerans]|jgi:flagella basal body P-ring formation protein FlgA|uniref:flagellar basal body P-ring formation chaperone FlgA n=1 Tax=Methylobacterium radiotolerans TaxID=31998 RepID=UPI00031EE580|nr:MULTISPECIES: flagellar basal body P-ring formation chaperone FlgA [Methylobacterium]KTS12321.1 flagellar basal body P-ring biosynthesis protein FlgA [Methylobacterium radiotolerans]KTS44224.1 flagellar basal body P-ring biosynthesis protein FlgA [Methylobacterium radiotolerans]MDE3748756.1 flagellar basal body P-ring formation chaperone FlgA [Methylobacterium radiotolerans]GEM97755.1 flagella basal body P-ring formation protein FlgA [Methylobacterium radiotolerans]